MLTRLYLENFALTDKLEIKFDAGLSVLTGETGAGKSILVGALARLFGDKADQTDIRSGHEMAAIECDFDLSENDTFRKLIISELKNNDIEYENGLLTIRREIFTKRPSKSFINGQMVPLVQIRRITQYLAELFGQHSHQRLLDENNHLGFLDNFAGLSDQVEQLRQLYLDWDKSKRNLSDLIYESEQRKKELELYQFQRDEIKKADIRVGEEEELRAEKKILDSSRLLAEKSSLLIELLDRGQPSALEILGSCRKEFSDMAAVDKSLKKHRELLEQAVINLDEFRTEVESYASSIPNDPERQEEINLRLDEIFLLKNKYGGSEEAILATLASIEERLADSINIDDQIKKLKLITNEVFEEYSKLARDISTKRQKVSGQLSKYVESELNHLGMSGSKFLFEFSFEPDKNGVELDGKKVKPAPNGLESGRFLISANPGEPLKPLARTASGGEISRIMLALKAADKQKKNYSGGLLVFDEIDVGIGGETAIAVANKLDMLAKKYQLLVVTHLHQIASKSRHHYAVTKAGQKSTGRNIITIKRLNKSEKADEIRRMLALPEKVR